LRRGEGGQRGGGRRKNEGEWGSGRRMGGGEMGGEEGGEGVSVLN